MSQIATYYKGDKEFHVSAMRKYAKKKQEIDKLLEKLIAPYIKNKKLKTLDAACGLGHLSFLLSKLAPKSTFLGVDQTAPFIEEAKKLYGNQKNMSFEVGNVEDLPAKHQKSFDISVSRAAISWIPYYEKFVKALFDVTKSHIFISSLFYEGDIDFEIKVREFKKESGRGGFSEYRNVYSLPRFTRFVRELGAKKVGVRDFEIGVDLPKGPVDQMGTYTVKLENGKRVQISGAVLMNWKWIRIDL